MTSTPVVPSRRRFLSTRGQLGPATPTGVASATRSSTLGKRRCESVKSPQVAPAFNTRVEIFVHCTIIIVDAREGLFKARGAAHLTITRNPRTGERVIMTTDKKHKLSEDSMGAAFSSFGASTKSTQAITAEVIDYAKKSFEGSAAAWERLLGAKTLDQAAEIQSEYLRSAFEDFVARTTKLGELYVDLAKETYKPVENVFGKAWPIK